MPAHPYFRLRLKLLPWGTRRSRGIWVQTFQPDMDGERRRKPRRGARRKTDQPRSCCSNQPIVGCARHHKTVRTRTGCLALQARGPMVGRKKARRWTSARASALALAQASS
eukprot:1692622-Rhodomonas_salina.3